MSRPQGPVAAPPTLLPGAPGESPIQRAARAVKQAEVWTQRLHDTGMALERRLGTEDSPTESERQAFLAEELSWRLAMKGYMNHFQSAARPEAVNRLGELVDSFGGKLRQIRIHLGGE